MELTGHKDIAAPQDHVWAHLNSTRTMQAAIPGCTSFTGTREDGYLAHVEVNLGLLRKSFTGRVALKDVIELRSYRLVAAAGGGNASTAQGTADVTLTPTHSGTQLTYRIEIDVTGRITRFGMGLLSGVASRMADVFFARFQEIVESGQEP